MTIFQFPISLSCLGQWKRLVYLDLYHAFLNRPGRFHDKIGLEVLIVIMKHQFPQGAADTGQFAAPNIQIDWTRDGSDRFSVPIGIGTIGLFRWGKMPVRWGVELQHYVMQPDPVGAEWNLKLFIAPIKANPFK